MELQLLMYTFPSLEAFLVQEHENSSKIWIRSGARAQHRLVFLKGRKQKNKEEEGRMRFYYPSSVEADASSPDAISSSRSSSSRSIGSGGGVVAIV